MGSRPVVSALILVVFLTAWYAATYVEQAQPPQVDG
jgi:hypothetical protein